MMAGCMWGRGARHPAARLQGLCLTRHGALGASILLVSSSARGIDLEASCLRRCWDFLLPYGGIVRACQATSHTKNRSRAA